MAVRRWWIFAFIVSLIVFLSALLLLGGEAYAKSGGGGSGGGGLTGGLTSGGDLTGGLTSGGGGSGGGGLTGGLTSGGDGGGGGDSAKGGGQQPAPDGGHSAKGGDGPINNITSGNGNPSKNDVLGDATGSLRDAAKNDARPSPEGAPPSPTEKNEKNSEQVLGTLGSVERVADTAEPAMEPASRKLGEEVGVRTVGPVSEEATKAVKPVAESAEPLMEQANPLVKPVEEATHPLVRPIDEKVTPITEAARPILDLVTKESSEVLEPLSSTLEPIAKPLEQVRAPVVGLVGEVAKPFSAIAGLPVLSPHNEATSPILDPLGSQLEPVSVPMTVAPVTGAGEQMFEPVPAERLVPFLGSDGQPYWLQPGGESPASQLALLSALTTEAPAAASISTLNSATVTVAQEGNLESSASNATANLSSTYPQQQVVLSLFEEGLSSLNLARMEGAENQMPQPFPAPGGMPVAAGGFSGGSSSSSSGGGLEMGLLGLLAVLLLSGKFLWSTCDFLKPNTVLLLAIDRPG
jgi:hypothetical protein